ncbi:MAG: hypothetical protein HY017_25690 [Betaproteobacteria bacterium]|nr:hypothetical protein [Betaproteobacteria bacterium]
MTTINPWLRRAAAAMITALAGGCASYTGDGLIAGKSTSADVEALMGRPTEQAAGPDGASIWFYPRGPEGRHTYAVTLGADRVVRAVEQRLTYENVAKLVPGATTAKETRLILGPPAFVSATGRLPGVWWEYPMVQLTRLKALWIRITDDGIVRDVIYKDDPLYDAGGPHP